MTSDFIPLERELSEEDSSEDINEIECKLYSIVHYNDLTDDNFPEKLPEEYDIELNKAKEIVVSLKCDDLSDNWQLEKSSNSVSGVEPAGHLSTNQNDDEQTKDIIDTGCVETPNKELKIENEYQENSCNKETIIIINEKSKISPPIINLSDDSEEEKSNEHNNVVIPDDIEINCPTLAENKEPLEVVISSDEENTKKNSEVKSKRKYNKEEKSKHRKNKKLQRDCRYPKKWTPSMVEFYSRTSKDGFNFDALQMIRKMRESSGGKQLWTISNDDLHQLKRSFPRVRCNKCRQPGHEARDCTERERRRVCVCGEDTHGQYNCPNRQCLSCGRAEPIFVERCSKCIDIMIKGETRCNLCNSALHTSEVCPDLWRGFHSTTKPGTLVIPVDQTPRRVFCSNCRKPSHFNHECQELTYSKYVIETPLITNYHKIAQFFSEDSSSIRTKIKVNNEEWNQLYSDVGSDFLQDLSNDTKARLEMDIAYPDSITVIGSFDQQEAVFSRVRKFLKYDSTNPDLAVPVKIGISTHTESKRHKFSPSQGKSSTPCRRRGYKGSSVNFKKRNY